MILLIDNYDSFTYNLVQRLGEIDPSLRLEVQRNDQITTPQIAEMAPSHIIISPGPCTPNEAGISLQCARLFGGKIPLLGVCLGHQSIAQAYGATIVRADRLMHGKVSRIRHTGDGLFAGLTNPFEATRYHSLIVPEESLGEELLPCAWSDDPDHPPELMGFRHRRWPLHGVQFHPESVLTDVGHQILRNFLEG